MFCSGIRHRGEQTAFNLTISSNVSKWSVITDGIGFTPASPVTVSITVETGVLVRDLTLGAMTQAMNLNGLPTGSIINLTNLGYIQGQGGAGGNGGPSNGSNGGTGGRAIRGPGAGVTLNITNEDGHIWGGGGGGGAGGGCQIYITADLAYDFLVGAPGAGGGGGAGGAAGGTSSLDSGEDGTSGVSGTFGQGGEGHTGTHGDAGNGGNWGSSGNAGQPGVKHGGPSDGATAGTGGVAGAAGPAIDADSGTIVFVNGSASPNVRGAIT